MELVGIRDTHDELRPIVPQTMEVAKPANESGKQALGQLFIQIMKDKISCSTWGEV